MCSGLLHVQWLDWVTLCTGQKNFIPFSFLPFHPSQLYLPVERCFLFLDPSLALYRTGIPLIFQYWLWNSRVSMLGKPLWLFSQFTTCVLGYSSIGTNVPAYASCEYASLKKCLLPNFRLPGFGISNVVELWAGCHFSAVSFLFHLNSEEWSFC